MAHAKRARESATDATEAAFRAAEAMPADPSRRVQAAVNRARTAAKLAWVAADAAEVAEGNGNPFAAAKYADRADLHAGDATLEWDRTEALVEAGE